MAHLATRAPLGLAIQMDQRIGTPQPVGNGKDIVADQVLQHAVGVPLAIAERQAGNGAYMLFELADDAGGLRPVAGIVDARGHLVGDQAPVGKREEFDADDADIV